MIVFANRAFCKLTGYGQAEIVGRNCRFLQGPDTDPENVARICAALEAEDVILVGLLNYRKDGTPFWNAMHIGPIYDSAGDLLYFFGSQWDVTDVHAARAEERHAKAMSRELSHRVKKMFAVIGGIVNVTSRTRGIRDEAWEINARIQALGRAHEATLDDASRGRIDLIPAIRSVLAPYDPEGGRFAIRGEDAPVEPSVISTVGLTPHELAINATKYGALSVEDGRVEIEIGSDGTRELRLSWQEHGCPLVTPPNDEAGSGIEIMDTLLKAARGTVERTWRPEGLRAVISLRDVDPMEAAR